MWTRPPRWSAESTGWGDCGGARLRGASCVAGTGEGSSPSLLGTALCPAEASGLFSLTCTAGGRGTAPWAVPAGGLGVSVPGGSVCVTSVVRAKEPTSLPVSGAVLSHSSSGQQHLTSDPGSAWALRRRGQGLRRPGRGRSCCRGRALLSVQCLRDRVCLFPTHRSVGARCCRSQAKPEILQPGSI